MTSRDIWAAEDEDHVACVLEWQERNKVWYLSMTEGPFSGYPCIELKREDLVLLRDALDKELDDKEMKSDETILGSRGDRPGV